MIKTVCIRQFFRPEPSIVKPKGWGDCAKIVNGVIVYCKTDKTNKNCGGYYPIRIMVDDAKEYTDNVIKCECGNIAYMIGTTDRGDFKYYCLDCYKITIKREKKKK
jgi:hypothetical protein